MLEQPFDTKGTNFTIPENIMPPEFIERVDHGPFYLFTPGIAVHRVGQRDSVPHIHPCTVTPCTDWVQRLPEEHVIADTVIRRETKKDKIGNDEEFLYVLIRADKILENIMDAYQPWGLVEISAFRHLHPKDETLALKDFNGLLYPTSIEPLSDMSEELRTSAQSRGGLLTREAGIKELYAKLNSGDLKVGADTRKLWLAGLREILYSFTVAYNYCMTELSKSDSLVQLAQNGSSDGKQTYDGRDRYMQWLLARHPVNEALTAIAGKQAAPQQINVQLPNNPNGLTREDLLAALQMILNAKGGEQVPITLAPGASKDVYVDEKGDVVKVEPEVIEAVLPKVGKK